MIPTNIPIQNFPTPHTRNAPLLLVEIVVVADRPILIDHANALQLVAERVPAVFALLVLHKHAAVDMKLFEGAVAPAVGLPA